MHDLGFSQIKLRYWRYIYAEIDTCNRLLLHGTATTGKHEVVYNMEGK